jgi:hypothetical protein
MEPKAVRKALLTGAVAIAVSVAGTPALASDFVVNGRAASAAEARYLVSSGAQPGKWIANGFGIAPADIGGAAERTSATRIAPEGDEAKCYYVLDVRLCD